MTISHAIEDFHRILPLAGVDASLLRMQVIDRGCPHSPGALPNGKMAVYVFCRGADVLKVGKVGPKSTARFQSQHYLPSSSKSNLAASLLGDKNGSHGHIPADQIGSWMHENLHRVDILLNAAAGISVLTLLESYLHCRLKPRYEGFKAQQA